MEPALRAVHLSKRYPHAPPGVAALDDVSLDIPMGKIYGLIGRNGAGKTTFVRIGATQLLPSSGEFRVFGLDVRTDTQSIRRRVAAIPQESRPLYFLSVFELIYYYLKLRGHDRLEARRRTNDVLAELSLEPLKDQLVNRLSGGMRRRAMVAMVLASDAEILFLDEPTTGLDPLARREVWEAILRTVREKRTVLLTTHYLDEAEALSARLALLEEGHVRLEGTPEEIRERVGLPYRLTVQGPFQEEDLHSFGKVSRIEGGFLVFAREKEARELARQGLERGARISLAPVRLEDIFLQVVGRSIEEDAPLAEAA